LWLTQSQPAVSVVSIHSMRIKHGRAQRAAEAPPPADPERSDVTQALNFTTAGAHCLIRR